MEKENSENIRSSQVSGLKTKEEPSLQSATESDVSLSLSPLLLSDNAQTKQVVEEENLSDNSFISEHLNSNSDSVENDRSDQEIEVSHLPESNFVTAQPEVETSTDGSAEHISQETKPPSFNLVDEMEDNPSYKPNSILDEILKSEHFKSDSERTLQNKSNTDSNENSFNMFDGVNLNDSLIDNYDADAKNKSLESLKNSMNSGKVGGSTNKIGEIFKSEETSMNVKEVAVHAESESLKESNQSTMSLNTSTTDYKLYHDEVANKIADFQNAISQRDSIIQQLTEALQQSITDREQLKRQSENLSKDIILLKTQLFNTAIFGGPKPDPYEISERFQSLTDTSIQTDLETHLLNDENAGVNFDDQCSKLQETLTDFQKDLLKEIKNSVYVFVQQKTMELNDDRQNEFKILQDRLEKEKIGYEAEIARLKKLVTDIQQESVDFSSLRNELEFKHAKEMEELRTYFEKRCSEMEKNYSEEIFSQQSRKLSGSSSCSETSEFIFSNPHGPGGDTVQICVDATKYECSDLTKNDVVKLKTNLVAINTELNKFNVDNIGNAELIAIKTELNKYDFRSLLKYDLALIKSEIQNKYHAELEILREDYENRIDALNVENTNRIHNLERKYADKMDSLKFDLDESLKSLEGQANVPSQEAANSDEHDLAEVIQNYERRLQEQVNLAKIDIINALEQQIKMLVSNTAEDTEWPAELLQLKNRFTDKYERDITELKEKHEEEIIKLKEDHRKKLNGALERARRRSLKDDGNVDLIKERDDLKQSVASLRHLIGELMNYFNKCEDELNNTIVEELLKNAFDKNLTDIELNLNESSNSTCSDSTSSKKRVHIAPKFNELIASISASNSSSLDSSISVNLKTELGACFQRLKEDANAILAASSVVNKANSSNIPIEDDKLTRLQERVTALVQQLSAEARLKEELLVKMDDSKKLIDNLDKERSHLETQMEQLLDKQKILETDLNRAREKIADLVESGKKEIVSEGFGQNSANQLNSDKPIATLADLQEKVRVMVVESTSKMDHPLLEVVDELCRAGDRIIEDAKQDHDDLHQQVGEKNPHQFVSVCLQKIEAADKKLKATHSFLEEQATEREQERDEAQKQIAYLQEQLRERDKDRVSCERINKEIEQLEQQMRDMSKLMEENEKRTNEIELEKKEAIDKIFVLRDIIRDLENQVETKTNSEAELQTFITQLEDIIKQQNKTNAELTQNLNSINNVSDAEDLQEIIKSLEDQIKALKLNLDFAGSEGVFKQMKTQLNELEVNIDKRTKDLEALHSAISTTTCSSPSEDISIRDQMRPKTPSTSEDCDVPLQQLARLKEKLVKHSRAEDAAIKRIRDLEMELEVIRNEFEDVQHERDILQDQVSEQLVLISSLQMRLDDQRLRAEHVQKQTNTSLELRIYDLENEIKGLVDALAARDKTIKHLNKTIEDTQKRLNDHEQQLNTSLEDPILAELQNEIKKLRTENASLVAKISNDAQNVQILPNLVDNILSDKNKEIDSLREKLEKKQSDLNMYLSLNLDFDQLKALSRLQSSERAFSDILSLIDVDSPDSLRMAQKEETLNNSNIVDLGYKRNANETTFMGVGNMGSRFEPEISSIENVNQHKTDNLLDELGLPVKRNSTEIQRSSEKRVHFEDSVYTVAIEKLQEEVDDLKNQLIKKDEIVGEYMIRIKILEELDNTIEELKKKLDFTEDALQNATTLFEKEQSELKLELAEKKMHLSDKEKQLELIEEDSKRKDQMFINLAKEKRDLEKTLKKSHDNEEHYRKLENTVSENESEISKLKCQLNEMQNQTERISHLEVEINQKESELQKLNVQTSELQKEIECKSVDLNEYRLKLSDYDIKLKENERVTEKLENDIENKEYQINMLQQELEELKQIIINKTSDIQELKFKTEENGKQSLTKLESKVKELKELIVDRETEIEILNEDVNHYQEDIANLENKLKHTKKSLENEFQLKLAQNERDIAAKELKIVKLLTDLDDANREVNHLQELIKEKDRVVFQMNEDTKSLHINLETIQNKIKETGNVIDLRKQLEDEKQSNLSLRKELTSLQHISESLKPIDMSASIEAITGEVKKQLEYSAHLDSNILTALNSNDSSLLETDNVQLLKDNLSKEVKLNRVLKTEKGNIETELEKLRESLKIEKQQVHFLKISLETEKQNWNTIQLEDANMLEQLRIRLESAIQNESEFEKLLNKERFLRQQSEKELEDIKVRGHVSSNENSKTEFTEYKSLPGPEQYEIGRLRSELKIVKGENIALKNDIKILKRGKNEIETNLKYSEDMLQFKNQEIQKLHSEIFELKKAEFSIQQQFVASNGELKQRNIEIENSRILMAEFEHDSRAMKKEIEKLRGLLGNEVGNIRKSNEDPRNCQVPKEILHKIKELSVSVKEYSKDNKRLTEVVNKLTDERNILQNRLLEFEQATNLNLPADELVARTNHLFARYLRCDSYRKALIWQKRYLAALLATYNDYPILSKEVPIYKKNNSDRNQEKCTGIKRFKIIVISITAVIRMQYLVRRWNSGKRAVHKPNGIVGTNLLYPRTIPLHIPMTSVFQVGKPVSRQNFSAHPPLVTDGDDLSDTIIPGSSRHIDGAVYFHETRSETPRSDRVLNISWSGATPPSKEHRSFPPNLPQINKISNDNSDLLKAPALLTQYLDRFDHIQQRLGLAIERNSN